MNQTRMPFLNINAFKNQNQVFIGETEFVNETNNEEQVQVVIYLAGPQFDEDKMKSVFGQDGDK